MLPENVRFLTFLYIPGTAGASSIDATITALVSINSAIKVTVLSAAACVSIDIFEFCMTLSGYFAPDMIV